MLSKGGVREWFCPHCGNANIRIAEMFLRKVYVCDNCNRWGMWKERGTRRAILEEGK